MVSVRSLSLITLLVSLTLCMGCRDPLMTPTPDDSDYYPLEVGNYRVYQVTLKKYVAANSATTQIYQLQEKVSGSSNRNGQLVFFVEESTRPTNQSAWKLNAIHTVYKSISEVVEQENNGLVVSLAFPIIATPFWNKNLYNSTPLTRLQYQQVGRPFSVGKLGFNDTVSVIGANDSTLVSQEKYQRVYARAIGCIYREDRSLTLCQSSPACIGQGIIEAGTSLTWELIASDRLP